MGRIANVRRVTKSVGGREIQFRSLLESRWAVWLQLQKEQGFIKDWCYEDLHEMLVLKTKYFGNKKQYLPDFIIETNEGVFELHECKGWFPPRDATKLKLAAEQYENPITLIFANLKPCKSRMAQYRRAKRLEPYLKRIIYEANKEIFSKIKGLF